MKPEDFEKKVLIYLKKNHYRITERCPEYIIFTDDEFNDRESSRSDIYTRVGEGKLVFHSSGERQTTTKLIYLTPVTFPLSFMVIMSAFGIYTESIGPIILSFIFTIPILFRIFYIKGNMFKEILEC